MNVKLWKHQIRKELSTFSFQFHGFNTAGKLLVRSAYYDIVYNSKEILPSNSSILVALVSHVIP